MTALVGSTTRRGMTALTLRVTLSRVMTSCGGTSIASWRRLTRTIWSRGRKIQMRPGPAAACLTRPRRKMTPRSYSLRMLRQLTRERTTMTMKKKSGRDIMGSGLCRPDCGRRCDCICRCGSSSCGRLEAVEKAESGLELGGVLLDGQVVGLEVGSLEERFAELGACTEVLVQHVVAAYVVVVGGA